MILLLLAMVSPLQEDSADKADAAYCASAGRDQPERFCLADRAYTRGEAEIAALLPKARRAAVRQKGEIRQYSAQNGGVTLDGDPVALLDAGERAWEVSHKADCRAFGLARATGNAGTEGVTADLECRADRLAERSRYLKAVYGLGN